VGKRLASELDPNHEVYLADIVSPESEIDSLGRNFEVDVTDQKSVEDAIIAIQPDVICHLAAKVSFKWSLEEPRKDLFLHALGTVNVLEAARKIKPYPHIVYAGSSAIFGNAKVVPTPEDCPSSPTSPYGVSKLAGEKYCEAYENAYGIPISILRFTNIYGPGSDHGVVSAFVNRALTRKPLTIYGGGQEIQFVYISDVVQAYRIAIERRITGTFNIGGPDVVTLKELAKLVIQETNELSPVIMKPPVEGDIQQVIFDTSQANKVLDWWPSVSTEEGIRKCVEYTRKHLVMEQLIQ